MARFSKGPHLHLRPLQKGQTERIWYIVDGDKRISTKLFESQKQEAQQEFANYLSMEITTKNFGRVGINQVTVAEVVILYVTDCIDAQARPDETRARLRRIVEFFGNHTVDKVPGSVKAYVRWRTHAGKPGRDDPPRPERPVKESSPRRELEDLRAAINHAFKSRKIDAIVPIDLPEASTPRERWLTRSEAARLLAGSLGFILAPYSDVATKKERWRVWRRDRLSINYHAARFILLGLHTATRHSAILGLGFKPHPGGGHFDLEHGVFYRAAAGARKTKKRQPPARIPRRLTAHVARWKRLASHDQTTIVAFNGKPIERIHKAFRGAVENAGLDSTVTPHILRHTCVTWRMQRGIPAWKVGGFAGMTIELIESTYGHHSPNFLADDADDF